MKKKKIKRMIKELTNKFEKGVNLQGQINKEEDLKLSELNKKIKLIDERTMALDNIKVQKTLDKTKELDSKVKILMDRTSVHYDTYSATDIGITFENCYQIYRCMADRGATQEELNILKDCFNRYIFRSRLFKIYKDEVPTPEEIIDGKKEA